MNAERLKQLRRVCKAIKPEGLDMRFFSCGTTHCLYGWAYLDSWFRANTNIVDMLDRKGEVVDHNVCGNMNGFLSRAAAIFDITPTDAQYLFGIGLSPASVGKEAISKSEVLENIDRLIRGESAEPYNAYTRQQYSFD